MGETFNRNQIAKESGLDFPTVERVIKKTGLKIAEYDQSGKPLYDLQEFTKALEEYRKRIREKNNERGNEITELEDERLREVIRGLKLKNNLLAGKLLERNDVYQYIGEYVAAEFVRIKRMCLQQLVLKCRNKTAQELHTLGTELYNDYLVKQKEFLAKWLEKTEVNKEVKEDDNESE